MAAGAVANQDSMCAWLYLCADLRQMLVHRLGIGGRHSPTSRSGQIAPNIRPNRGDCPVPQVAVSQSAPTGRESTPSCPRWLRLGTTPPQACRPPPPAGLRSPGGRNFFENLLRRGIFLRAAGRGCNRVRPSLHSSLATLRLWNVTEKWSAIFARRSTQRQRTTPSFSGSGPWITNSFNSAICTAFSAGGRPERGLVVRPATPAAL